MPDVVLWVESPGLGDHLIYSTLPELFARQRRRVYVSKTTATRNDEVRALLYDENPFVTGWNDAPPNAGTGFGNESGLKSFELASAIQYVEISHGFRGDNIYPRIYYKPRFIADLADAVLLDPHSVSQRFPAMLFERFLQRLNLPTDRMYVVSAPHSGEKGRDAIPSCPRLPASDIHEYVDMIHSCATFVSTESGASILASAVRQHHSAPNLHAITTTRNYNEHTYILPNIRYTVVGGLQRDW